MSMETHLKKLSAEKVLLLEIDATHYLADTAYVSEPGDTPASQPYDPVIEEGGIPRFTRRIQELWGGRSMASWGTVQLATATVNGVDLSAANLRGKVIAGYITGPRHLVALSDRLQFLKGVIGPKSVNADGGLSFDVLDDQARFEVIELPPNRYDAATMGAGFPAANHGLSKPLCLGRCRNVPATLIDASTWTYQVSDGAVGAIQAISNVYDNGVVVSTSSVDLNTGTFALSAAPSGIITADVDGVKDDTTWLSTTTEIVDWLARTYGGLSAGDIDISGLPSGVVGIYLNLPIMLDELLSRLVRGCLSWWQFTPTGTLRVQQITAPTSGGSVFTENEQLSDLVFEEEGALYWSIPLLYQRNWQRLQPAGSVAANLAAWLRSDGYESRIEDSAILTAYSYASTAIRMETYFDAQTDAEAVGTLALSMFGVPRYRGRVMLPISFPQQQLGDSINLQDCGVRSGDYALVGMTDMWDSEIPLVECEVWG